MTVQGWTQSRVWGRRTGLRRVQGGESTMRRIAVVFGSLLALSLALVGNALAVTVPSLTPAVQDYGDTILDNLVGVLSAVFPYAAAFTVLAIGVGVMRRWIGKRKATNIA